jgi:hypothetical protein
VAHDVAVGIGAGRQLAGVDREDLDRERRETLDHPGHGALGDPPRLADLVEQQQVPPRRVPLRPVDIGVEAALRGVRGQVVDRLRDRGLDRGAGRRLRVGDCEQPVAKVVERHAAV